MGGRHNLLDRMCGREHSRQASFQNYKREFRTCRKSLRGKSAQKKFRRKFGRGSLTFRWKSFRMSSGGTREIVEISRIRVNGTLVEWNVNYAVLGVMTWTMIHTTASLVSFFRVFVNEKRWMTGVFISGKIFQYPLVRVDCFSALRSKGFMRCGSIIWML